MRNFVFRIVLAIVAILSFNSCYEPNGANNVDIEKPKPPESISIDYYTSGDTIFWIAGSALRFTFSAGGAELRWARLVFDSSETNYSNCELQKNGFYTYDPGRLQPGVHKVDVYIFTKTYTGSLADIMNAEGFVGKRRWTLIYLNSVPDILSVTAENGIGIVSWDSKAQLLPYCYLQKSLSMDWITIDSNFNIGQTNTKDRYYVGESCMYRLLASDRHGNSLQSETFYAFTSIPKLNWAPGENSTASKLSWERTPYDSGFQCYRIKCGSAEPIYIYDINQTSVEVPLEADFISQYASLTVVPKNQPKDFTLCQERFTQNVYLLGGELLPPRLNYLYDTRYLGSAKGLVYYLTRSYSGPIDYLTLIYDPATNTIADSISLPFESIAISFNGKYLLNYSNSLSQFCLFDAETKKVGVVYNYSDLSNMKGGASSANVSDNGTIVIGNTLSMNVFDGIRGLPISSAEGAEISYISPNGKYFASVYGMSCSLYRIYSDRIENIQWQDGFAIRSETAGFLSDDEFVYIHGSKMNVVNPNDKSTVSSVYIKYLGEIYLDLYNRKFCNNQNRGDRNVLDVLDIGTGELLGTASSKLSFANFFLSYPYLINSDITKVRIHS